MMESMNINGAIINDQIINAIKYMQQEKNNTVDTHCEALTELSDFLISQRENIGDDKAILDHVYCIRYVISDLKIFRV